MKPFSGTKLLVLHHTPAATTFSAVNSHKLFLLSLLSFFSLLSLLTLFSSSAATNPSHRPPLDDPSSASAAAIPDHLFTTLLHYAATSSASPLPQSSLLPLASSLRRLSPCNLLVFGLPHESLLLLSLNPLGRTVFLHDQPHHISILERTLHSHRLPPLEAYDISYTTRVADLSRLLDTSRRLRRSDCRPVQNLLFSDYDLALNDLPNHIYDIDWDLIFIDGPSGYSPQSPGRAASIFTAAVFARSSGQTDKLVDVFVHDYDRELERLCSAEFLCEENLVFSNAQLAHFSVRRRPGTAAEGKEAEFCVDRNTTAAGRRYVQRAKFVEEHLNEDVKQAMVQLDKQELLALKGREYVIETEHGCSMIEKLERKLMTRRI